MVWRTTGVIQPIQRYPAHQVTIDAGGGLPPLGDGGDDEGLGAGGGGEDAGAADHLVAVGGA